MFCVPVLPAAEEVLVSSGHGSDTTFFQGGDAAPGGKPAGSCKVAGVPEYCCVPKTQAGNATKCGFIATLVRHSAHLMLDDLPVQYRNVGNLELCSSRTEMLRTQLFTDGLLPVHTHLWP